MHPCIHVHYANLDLVNISQDMSATVRLMGTPNPMKKFSNPLMLQPRNPKILKNVPRFCPGKNFFILTLHTHRQSFDWPLISILTSQPIHEACSSPWKTSHMFSIYEKTVNHKTSQKVLLVATEVPYKSQLTLDPCHRPFMLQMDNFCFGPERATYSSSHNSDSGQRGIFLNFR